MSMESGSATTVNAVFRAFDIVEELNERRTAGVTEIAESVDLPPSTVYNHLQTLVEREYVAKDGAQYRLGKRFVHLGDSIKHRQELFRIGKPSITRLASETNATANLVVEEYGRGFYLMSETGPDGLRNYSHIRRREYLHSTAAGKSILIQLPDDRVTEILEIHGLPGLTDETITDREEFDDHLADAAQRGYTCNNEENKVGIRAVGAPIEHSNGSPGAVSISGPVNRVSEDMLHDELAAAVRNTAKSISIEVQS